MKKNHHTLIQLTHLPAFRVALVLALLEACTVFFVTFVSIPSQWNALTIALALASGILGGILFLLLLQVFLKKTKLLRIQTHAIQSISYLAPLWLITLFLVISFAIQSIVLPLIRNRLITLAAVSIITAGSLAIVSGLYFAIPFRKTTRLLFVSFKTKKRYIFLKKWSIGVLLLATAVFEFMFLLVYEFLLPLFSHLISDYGAVPLVAGISGFIGGIAITQIVNWFFHATKKKITINLHSKNRSLEY